VVSSGIGGVDRGTAGRDVRYWAKKRPFRLEWDLQSADLVQQ
jgi:hypothetical protein